MDNIIQRPSENCNERLPGTKPKFLIMHYTACDLDLSLKLLTEDDPDNPVSAHYLIDTNGDTYSLVPEHMRAWHAGRLSNWGPYNSLNSWSIGIELVNPGHGDNYHPFPDQQIDRLAQLSQEIMGRHQISPWNVLAHADIAPSRKSDPGELFPWQALANKGIGVYPPTDLQPISGDLEGLLREFGYQFGHSFKEMAFAIRAFCMHYLAHLSAPSEMEMVAALQWLIANHPAMEEIDAA
ncbi:MAG: N-acetylmuramoyl-L-alanine amidase [Alphaproteobacteria bacterium]